MTTSATAEPTYKDIDLSDKEFWARPPEERDAAFAVLRKECPVPWSRPADSDLLPPEQNLKGFWSLTKMEDIRYASRHPEIFSSAQGITMEDFPPEMIHIAQSFIAMDAPRHSQLRGITLDAFKPRNMRRLQDWIQGHARDLITEMSHLGEGDFVELVSVKLPSRIFGSFFGLPPGDVHEKTINAAQRLLGWTDPEVCGDRSALELFAGAVMDLHETASILIPERRENPGDDLISWMVQAEFDGKKMTDDELKAFFTLLAVAANDTTRHASAHAIYALSKFPEQRDLWWADYDAVAPTAVEEIIRWSSPVVYMRRTLTQDFELSGVKMQAGEKVTLWYGSANRDETKFDRPWMFDVQRNPNPHLGFGGGGAHFCLGANLARREIAVAFEEIHRRVPDLTATDEPDRLWSQFIHGIKRLPVSWTPPR